MTQINRHPAAKSCRKSLTCTVQFGVASTCSTRRRDRGGGGKREILLKWSDKPGAGGGQIYVNCGRDT